MDLARGQSVERFPYIWPIESMAGSANRELATGPAHYSDIRHPIERVWSQALLEFGYLKGRDVREVSSIAFLRQVERARNILSSDYCRTIKIWSNAFGWDALHIDPSIGFATIPRLTSTPF